MSKLNTDVLAIMYSISIGGKSLSLHRRKCIKSLDFKETDSGANTCTISIVDPEMVFIEDSLIVEDKKIKIKYGWASETKRYSFSGYISAIDIDFPTDGIPTLSITCMDETHIMNRKKRSKTYKKTTSASVVRQICKRYGFKCVIESNYKFTKQDSISQSKSTDAEFLTKLAGEEVYPFGAYLVGDTFYYIRKGKISKSKITLTYGKYPFDMLSFKPQINKETIKKEVKSSKVKKNKKVSSSTTKDNKNRTTDSKKTTKNNSGSKKSTTTHKYDPKTKKWTTVTK